MEFGFVATVRGVGNYSIRTICKFPYTVRHGHFNIYLTSQNYVSSSAYTLVSACAELIEIISDGIGLFTEFVYYHYSNFEGCYNGTDVNKV